MASEFLEILSEGALKELEQVEKLVKAIATDIKSINSFNASNTPSGADKNIKGMTDAYKQHGDSIEKVRKNLQKLSDAEKDAASKKKASMNAMWDSYEKGKNKEKELSDKQTAREIENAEKEAKAEIEKNNKITQSAQKRAEKESEIEAKKNKRIDELRQAQEAKWKRTGSSSVVPGMSSKIAEIKESERLAKINEHLSRSYVQLTNDKTKAKNKLQDLIASQTASRLEIRNAQKEYDGYSRRLAQADKAVGKLSETTRNYRVVQNSVSNLMSALGISTGLYLAFDVAKSVYNTTKELQSLDLALKMVSGTNQEYAENQNFVREVSEKWGLEVKSLTQQYTQFYTASKGLLSQEDIKTTFEGIAKAGSVMGLSLEKQKDAFYAIDQMMSKGNVTAEELKKQLGNAMPGAIKAAAMAYQELHPQIKTIQEAEKGLYEAMKKGALDSATYVPLIVKNLNKIYGIEMLNKVDTLQASQNRLQNSWTELVRSLNNSETGGLTRFFKFFTDNLAVINRELTRINDSWDSIFNKSLSKGRGSGKEMFGNLLEDNKKSGLSEEKATEYVLGFSRKKLLELRKKESEFVKALNSKDYQSKLSDGRIVGKDFIRREREALLYEIGQTEEMIGLARLKLGLDKEAKKPKNNAQGETEKEKKARLKIEKDQAKEREQILKEQYEAELSNLERQKQLISDLKDVEETSLQDKLFLEQAYAYKQIQIAQFVHDEKVRIADKEIKERKLTSVEGENLKTPINNELQTSIENAKSESLKRMNKLTEENLKKEDEKTKEWYKNNPPYFVENEDSKKAREETVKLNQKALEDVKNYIASFQIELGQNLGFDETFNFFLKMDEDGRTMFEKLNDGALSMEEKQKATFIAIAEAAQEMFNFISNASQQNFDAEYARLEKQKNAALEFAGESDEAKKKIEEDYEKRNKAIAIREFKAKQKLAIVNIAIDTAQAVMAVSAKARWWEVPLMIALGAVQAGIVASQKVPEFWQGGIHEGGMLKMNDDPYGIKGGNFREVALTPDGNIFKPQGKDVYADLPKGTEIFKDYKAFDQFMFNKDLNNIMMDNGIGNAPKIVVNNTGVTKSELRDVMFETLGSMAIESTNIDVNGFTKVISKGHSKTIEHTARITGMGLKIGR